MIFNEIYSAYYNAVARILDALTESSEKKDIARIVEENAFSESVLTVLPSLKNQKWQLIRSDMTTPIIHRPTMPMTEIQRQWLKAISLDPRIKLFGIELEGLDDVEPMFTESDYRVYDKYNDGDPYEDERYTDHFRTILNAIRQGHKLKMEIINRRGVKTGIKCIPKRLEYSQKDDKFRLISYSNGYVHSSNLARITSCEVYHGDDITAPTNESIRYEQITLKIRDDRNTLERCLLHFAHLEKNVERVNDNEYILNMKYASDDTSEMVIRVLSFGPTVEVIAPESFRELIKKKLIYQKSCELF